MTEDTTTERPLVTFALFAYNQEKYIREAVEGAFSQTYEPLEIILSDDCSSDRTFEIMQEMAAGYEGPHRVVVRRSEVNLGLLSHVLVVARESAGKYTVVAAGDDVSFQCRSEILTANFVDDNVFAVSSEDTIIDSLGNEKFLDFDRVAKRDKNHKRDPTWIHGATAAYRTSFLQSLPLPDYPIFLEDQIFSDAMKGRGGRTNRIKMTLVQYRHHSENLSNRNLAQQSIGDGEEKVIQKWIRLNDCIKYSLENGHLRNEYSGEQSNSLENRYQIKSEFLTLMSQWKILNIGSRVRLVYLGSKLGELRSVAPRIFGVKVFNFLKGVQKVARSKIDTSTFE